MDGWLAKIAITGLGAGVGGRTTVFHALRNVGFFACSPSLSTARRLLSCLPTAMNQPKRKKVLVLGGNGFIGGATVERLLGQNIDVTTLNRNRSWDWGKLAAIKPRTRNIVWNRKQSLKDCTALVDAVAQTSFDAVVDFSGFYGYMVADAVEFLKSHTAMYVYISSDSVYEVCEKQHENPTRETDDTRPKDVAVRRRLKRQDSYGHHKLRGEEALRSHTWDELHRVILRLADVIGPRDSTDRWWQLQTWLHIAAAANVPVYIPSSLKNKKLSLVYVYDIADLIVEMISTDITHCHDPSIIQTFNLACTETVTMEELMELIRSSASFTSSIRYQYSDASDVPTIYPSVEKGPIDTSRAVSVLKWHPTPLAAVCQQCVDFYEQVLLSDQYKAERKDLYAALKDDLSPLYNKQVIDQLKIILRIE